MILTNKQKLSFSRIFSEITQIVRQPANWKFILFFLFCLGGFALYKEIILTALMKHGQVYPLIGAAFLSLAGMKIRMQILPPPMRIVLRFMLGLFGAYIFFSHPTLPLDSFSQSQIFTIQTGRYLAMLSAVAGFFFPAVGLIAFTYVLWYKKILAGFIGFDISWTDYTPPVEIGIFIILSALIWTLMQRFRFWEALTQDRGDPKTLAPLEKLFVLAVSTHMANYFWSGVKKLGLGDYWYSWALHNKTQHLISNSDALNQLPISFSDSLIAFSYDWLSFLIVPTNFILLFGQLFALIALFRIRWGIWTTAFYDLTHLVIFFTSGIFFYKWIILNIAVILALETIKGKIVPLLLKAMIVVTIIGAPALFFVAKLGWWDTPALNIERFVAITKDNREIPVPSNFWGAFSVRFAQERIIWEKADGFFPTGTYGIVIDQRLMEQAEACDYNLPPLETADIIDKTFGSENNIIPFVRNYHRWALEKAGADGRLMYDYYPHHIFSSPWEFREFMRLDLRDIVAYRYRITAACLGYENGKLIKKIVREKHYDIPLHP